MDRHASLSEFYRDKFLGQSISHVWNGYGSALFLEFGKITPNFRRDGSRGNGDGELGLMIEWGWRIEHKSTIVCGSSSENTEWALVFAQLIGQRVIDLSFVGYLPEITLHLSNNFRLLSFMDVAGGPEWALFDRGQSPIRCLHFKDGQYKEGASEKRKARQKL